jgi:hypothetical protein
MDRKVFSRSEIQMKSNNSQTDSAIEFITEEPDSTTASINASTLLGSTLADSEDASLEASSK